MAESAGAAEIQACLRDSRAMLPTTPPVIGSVIPSPYLTWKRDPVGRLSTFTVTSYAGFSTVDLTSDAALAGLTTIPWDQVTRVGLEDESIRGVTTYRVSVSAGTTTLRVAFEDADSVRDLLAEIHRRLARANA